MHRTPPMVTLRAIRRAHELTLAQLAERIEEQGVRVDQASLSNIEIGRKKGSDRLMGAWARALRIGSRLDVYQTEDLHNLVAGDRPDMRSA
ncbi:helix-turn-helix domain-containing protein [Actinomadura litoris]|uniref:helix-turn-helix domain-containing protein n=1 Tax=Actinomadura litoris TaxID=2678616 RepID=UPI001FA80CD0|nr:helix-turn-helix transcriptional regulator [Actinomadura litoris]